MSPQYLDQYIQSIARIEKKAIEKREKTAKERQNGNAVNPYAMLTPKQVVNLENMLARQAEKMKYYAALEEKLTALEEEILALQKEVEKYPVRYTVTQQPASLLD